MNRRQLITTALAFSLAAATPAFATSDSRPFHGNGDAQWSYIQKFAGTDDDKRQLMRFVSNVFNFDNIAMKDSKFAWTHAAEAAYALAKKSPADYARIECIAQQTIAGMVTVVPANRPATDKNLPLNGDYAKRLVDIAARPMTTPAACRPPIL